jgi:hypothetical protein
MARDLQALIESQISKGGVGGGVLLPKGVFEVDDTLTIASVRGLRFSGQSPWATELRWVGPDDRPMFEIDRSEDILLEHFSISVGTGKTLLAAAWIENGVGRRGPTAAPGGQSTHISWNNVRVVGDGRLLDGFHVKLFDLEKDVKNDHHSFEHVTVTGYTDTAFKLEGRNAKNLGFDRCNCLGMFRRTRVGKYAIDTSTHVDHGAAFVWNKGSVIGNECADFRIGDRNDTIKIDGVSSEKSARMLQIIDQGGANAGEACPVLVENYRFGAGVARLLPDDREVIQCQAAGPLSVVGCKIGSGRKGLQLRLRYEPNPGPGAFNLLGNAIADDGDGPVFTASPPTMPYEYANLGYRNGQWQALGSGV